ALCGFLRSLNDMFKADKEGFLYDKDGNILPLAGGQFNMNAFSVVNPNAPVDIFQPQYDRVNLATSVTGDYALFAQLNGKSGVTLIRAAATATVTKTDRDTSMKLA